MYKGASQAMQHAHGVDIIHRSRGMIDMPGDADILPNAGNMGLAMCRDELRQSAVELARVENALAMAKRLNDKSEIAFLGQKKASICARRSSVKERQREIVSEHDAMLLTDAINAVCNESIASKVFAYAKAARNKLIDSATQDSSL